MAAIVALAVGPSGLAGQERTVRNAGPFEAAPGWSIGPPVLELGRGEASASGPFTSIVDAVLLSDGRIAVADAGAGEIRVFAASGEPLATFGREGDGPGEFRRLASLHLGGGDTIFAFDAAQGRISAFDPDGTILGDTRIREGRVSAVGRLAGSAWYSLEPIPGATPAPGELGETRALVHVRDAAGANPRRVTEVGAETWAGLALPGQPPGFRHAPFTPSALHDAHGRCLYLASGRSPALDVWSVDARHLLRAENGIPTRPVEPDHLAAWGELVTDGLPSAPPPSLIQALLDAIPVPDHLPWWNDLLVDPLGWIWLQEYAPPAGEGTRWAVLAPNGSAVGMVSTPEPVRLLAIGEEHLIGRAVSALGEHILVKLPLERGESATGVLPCSVESDRRLP